MPPWLIETCDAIASLAHLSEFCGSCLWGSFLVYCLVLLKPSLLTALLSSFDSNKDLMFCEWLVLTEQTLNLFQKDNASHYLANAVCKQPFILIGSNA